MFMYHKPINNSMHLNFKQIWLTFLFLIFFTVFSILTYNGFFTQVDFDTTVKIQERIDTSSHLRTAYIAGEIMEGSVFLASPGLSVVIIIIITALTVINLKQKKIHFSGLMIPVLFSFLVFAELYGKSVVHHPPPPFFMLKNPITVFPRYFVFEEFSYPSGHAARAVFISIILISITMNQCHNLTIKKKCTSFVSLISLFYMSIVSLSLIYLGHHWASDVIGGVILGFTCAVPVWIIFSRQRYLTEVK
ncbi:hypothetical protein A2154_01210 [Candidatus Gottesmanbacteria bacterium RBG_16_43_7]|uniref:Phosphatidic acid phosphatase type 2/haloperoxidase domain-containing protein n=1 Tax=Candidatus Gottesmanbacteria bacterium RBG_16_43_7 TaxID=1798373 RepID=A0A1F5Z8F1_9BACT|nr:MAG: hypothetical protein A2154_01210 [Candidatus Gottesmanbacteria bacterium RBG_16_43_7]